MYGEQQSEAAAHLEGAPTAFRAAEKLYQLHREQVFRQRKGKRVSKGVTVRPTDLSAVLDLGLGGEERELPPGVARLALPPGVPSCMPPSAAAYAFEAHPGLLLVRGALPPALQRQLIVDAFTRYCEPPNHTTLMRTHPAGLPGIWAASQQGLRLQPSGEAAGEAAHGAASAAAAAASDDGSIAASSLWGAGGSGATADSLLRKLRWATLGPPYDWTQRRYLREARHDPLPPQLRCLAAELAGLAASLLGAAAAAVRGGAGDGAPGSPGGAPQAFCPDAALINYYYEGDTLNGHVDDAENSLAQPLVSLSLGCDAVLLMGGRSRDVPPTPLLLRSGDAVVLAGDARRCYHGVPRVLTDRPLPETLREGGGGTGGGGAGDPAAFAPFARHMRQCRINISIRDTR